MPTVQTFTQEPREKERFRHSMETSFKAAVHRIHVRAFLAAFVIAGIIFSLMARKTPGLQGELSVDELASCILYAALVAGSVSTIAEVWGRSCVQLWRESATRTAEQGARDPQPVNANGARHHQYGERKI